MPEGINGACTGWVASLDTKQATSNHGYCVKFIYCWDGNSASACMGVIRDDI